MTSKGKKPKKKNDSKIKLKEESDRIVERANVGKLTAKACFNTFFSNDEITEIKTILKTKDLSGWPFITGATVLDKLELIKKLLKLGFNINETGQNNTTALYWSVKLKYTDITEFLLSKGADPTIKTDSGENILVVALEHKLWDEQSFIKLWKQVKTISFIDVNFYGKNGHNMLHMAIRRDWEEFVAMLCHEKPNIDAANVNGITPLMLACFRNNLNIVNRLLGNNASVIKEDTHRRTALCYAITTVMKGSKPPFNVPDRILDELKKQLLFSDYVRGRLEIIASMAEKMEIQYATSEMLINITYFLVQHSGTALNILLKAQVFDKLQQALLVCLEDNDKTKFYLSVILEILFYNEHSTDFSIETYNNMIRLFCCSKILDLLLDILKSKDEAISKICFYCILLTTASNEDGKHWLRENYFIIASYVEQNVSNTTNCFVDFQDDRLRIMKRRLKKLKRFLNSAENDAEDSIDQEKLSPNTDERYGETTTVNSKKTKRRSKALKARIAKIKIAELSERVNLTSKKLTESKLPSSLMELAAPLLENTDVEGPLFYQTDNCRSSEELFIIDQPRTAFEIENPIAHSFQYLLQQKPQEKKATQITNPNFAEWKLDILNLPFDDTTNIGESMSIDTEKLKEAFDNLRCLSKGTKINTKNINKIIYVVIEYFNELLNMILNIYQQHWVNDEKFCYTFFTEEGVPYVDYEAEKQAFEKDLEKYYLDELQKNYEQLVQTFRDLSLKNPSECYKCACKLESTLLNHEIRGRSLLPLVSTFEQIKIKHSVIGIPSDTNPTSNNDFLTTYMEGVLNDHIESRDDIKIKVIDKVTERAFMEYKSECPNELYYKEMGTVKKAKPRDKRKEFEIMQKTLDYAYHLESSIMKICESDDEEAKSKVSDKSDRADPSTQQSCSSPEYSEILLKALTKHVDHNNSEQNIPTRWSKFISSLKSMSTAKKLLHGDVRISCKEQRINHIISTGGNFNPVELGLDTNNTPLAVKRIPKNSSVCKVMKSLITPLLNLRNPHLLHYYVCDYEENELILATPLCEWNVGQYVLLMKQTTKSNLVNLSTMDIVRQFLSGLMFLHNYKEAITHGNLKPSNIFVDLKGVVRVAEFGTHQALFKIIEAPDTSLIWFARETYQTYKQNSIMECSTSSDIQVAGMLIHFILTGGKHPCGDGVYEILKNLEKAIPKLNTQDPILVDLVTWMMLYDPNERPNINQVLSHVFFWSSSRKWKYILTCAGITPHGTSLQIDVNELHSTIDRISKRDNIKGNWVDIIRNKYPNLLISNEDTVTGLLRFIRNYYEKQLQVEMRDSDLSNCILAWFPALPLSLQRILENTVWTQHTAFIPFNLVDPLH